MGAEPTTSKNMMERSTNSSPASQGATKKEDLFKGGGFPSFLVIEPKNEEIPLWKASPFLWERAIKGVLGCEPEELKRMGKSNLLVKIKTKKHAQKLLKQQKIADIPVKVSPHFRLNTSQGVFTCEELSFMTDDELLLELENQHVILVKRIINKRLNKPTNTFFVKFNTPTLPERLKMGFVTAKVRPYIPNPLRCFKCQKFGHGQSRCDREPICAKCGRGDHNEEHCSNRASCPNCSGDHPANSKACPMWLQEREIQRIKILQNLSYPQARAKINEKTDKPTYAAITKKTYASIMTQTETVSIMTQTETAPAAIHLPLTVSTHILQEPKETPIIRPGANIIKLPNNNKPKSPPRISGGVSGIPRPTGGGLKRARSPTGAAVKKKTKSGSRESIPDITMVDPGRSTKPKPPIR